MDDTELLRDFAERGSEDAFRALVTRYIDLVYSIARQTVSDPQLTEEVAQTVFVVMARKAASLTNVKALSAWLYRATRLAALQAVRNECRRREREENFVQMDNASSDSVWEQILPHLGEVMDQLGEADRTALVVRYFESKSLKDVANALGTGEDAARMRVNRAVQKLRGLFAKRGVVVSATALLTAVSANSVQAAPAGMAAKVVTVALTQKLALSTAVLMKETINMMAWMKLKIAALWVVAPLVLVGGATALFTQTSSPTQTADLATPVGALRSIVRALETGNLKDFAVSWHAAGKEEEKALQSVVELATAQVEFRNGLAKRFGSEQARSVEKELPLHIPADELRNAQIKREGDFAHVSIPGQPRAAVLVLVGGKWKMSVARAIPDGSRPAEVASRNQRMREALAKTSKEVAAMNYKSAAEAVRAFRASLHGND